MQFITCVADEIRRVMMETVIPTIISAVKGVASKTDVKSSQVLINVLIYQEDMCVLIFFYFYCTNFEM